MDDRSLTKRIQTLHKAAAKEPPSVVLQLLEELKKEPAPTEEQLRVRPLSCPCRGGRAG